MYITIEEEVRHCGSKGGFSRGHLKGTDRQVACDSGQVVASPLPSLDRLLAWVLSLHENDRFVARCCETRCPDVMPRWWVWLQDHGLLAASGGQGVLMKVGIK